MVLLRTAALSFVMHDPIDDQLAIVLGQRQLTAVCCMFLTVLGLVATLAYVAGRTITAAQFQARNDVPAEVSHPMVVDPPRALDIRAQAQPEPEPAPVPVSQALVGAAGARPIPSVGIPPRDSGPAPISIGSAVAAPVVITPPKPAVQAAAPPMASTGEPTHGQVFWQIGLVDPDTARQMLDRAIGLGLAARVASGNSPQSRRVLVGPLVSRDEIARVKQTLDSEQLQAFLKIY